MKQLCLFIFLMLLINSIGAGQPVERIFYSSFSPQDWDIYISRDSGKSLTKFTDHPSLDYDAVISPDGKWVVFTSERSGITQLYVKPADATGPATPLLKSNSFQDQAAFSPDGNWVVYTTEGYGINDEQALIQPVIFSPQMYGEIVAYNVNTKERSRITHNKWEDGAPLWVE